MCVCVGEVFDVWSVWGSDEAGTDCGLNPLRTGFVFSKLLFNLSQIKNKKNEHRKSRNVFGVEKLFKVVCKTLNNFSNRNYLKKQLF